MSSQTNRLKHILQHKRKIIQEQRVGCVQKDAISGQPNNSTNLTTDLIVSAPENGIRTQTDQRAAEDKIQE